MSDHPVVDKRTPAERKADWEAGWKFLYEDIGLGCARIARRFGVSDEQVYQALKRAGVHFRPRYPRLHPKVEFNGQTYTWSCKGYYRNTRPVEGQRSLLHHDIWEHYHGPVPAGYTVHHRDSNPHHNHIDNLVCVLPGEGTKLHHPLQETPSGRTCLWCGEPLRRKWQPGARGRGWRWETPSELKRRRFCDGPCSRAWLKGKPRGTRAEEEKSHG